MEKDNTTDSYKFDEELSPNFYSIDFYQKRKKGKFRLVNAPSCNYSLADTHCHVEMFKRPFWLFIRAAFHNISFISCVVDSTNDGPDGIKYIEDAYSLASQKLPEIVNRVKNSSKQLEDILTIKLGDMPEICLDKNSICDNPKMPKIKFTVGTHPHYSKDFNEFQIDNLYKMLDNKKVSCVGEIGLDYFYNFSSKEKQISAFKKQINIAKELKLPIALHLRDSHEEALKVLNEIGFDKYGTLLHCFNLGPEELKPWVDAGCYIALGGAFTFKNNLETKKALPLIPLDKLLIETDAPFMTPEPLRGDTCFSDHIIFTADQIYNTYNFGLSKKEFYKKLVQNANNLLNN